MSVCIVCGGTGIGERGRSCGRCRGGQLSLLSVLPKKRAATLEATRMGEQRALVLEALVELQGSDPVGHNAFRIQGWLHDKGLLPNIQRNAVSSRLAELATDYGFVLLVGRDHVNDTGQMEQRFVPTADGVEWVRIQQRLRAAA